VLLIAVAAAVVVALPQPSETQNVQLGDSAMAGDEPDAGAHAIIAAAVKKVHKDEYDAQNAALAHHRVSNAAKEVWMSHDFNAMYDKEMNGKHWHCTKCHRSCKTLKCRAWCHDKFCGKNYEKMLMAKSGVGRVAIAPGVAVIPGYANAVFAANKKLYEAEKATSDADLNAAGRGIKNVEKEQEEDNQHFIQAQKFADAVDAAAYPSEKQQQAIDNENYEMEKNEAKSFTERANEDAKETLSEANGNEGSIEAAAAAKEADKSMGGGENLMKEVEEDIAAEDSTLAADDASSSKAKPAMTEVANVAAAVETLAVKVKAASDAAGSVEKK